jgi:salicylate hydroxylase
MTPGLKRTAAHTGLRVASKLLPSAMIGAFNWLYHHDVTTK